MFINLINFSSTIIEDAFSNIEGKLGELSKKRSVKVAREMIPFFMKNMSRYHHHHHHYITPLLCHYATPLLPMYHHLYHITCNPYPLNRSTL